MPTLFLGHGASGDARSMAPWVAALRPNGVEARTLQLPKANAERAADVFRTSLRELPDAAIGGHSYGGRAASLVAAGQDVTALILLSYPLHRPGHPDDLRTDHWPRITCPVLVLSGDHDQFANIELLRREVRKLRTHELVVLPGQRHGLLAVKEEAAARIAAFLSV
ncbi:MAG: dienelactone hydrolase family protein [Candidatus Dormibacteraeota bacterium]|nr:dienelactone hydrolase family protein [Candidatus Dormibacteraeota bacterium]